MSAMKSRLQADLTTAMKARDELTTATLRMAMTAITNEEVAGKEQRVLSDDDVLLVLGREAKKRRESAEAYAAAGRTDLADREQAELAVLGRYLPQPLTDDEVRAIVAAAVAEAGVTGPQALGAVMKLVQPQVRGRADGGAVAALVREALGA
jgi:uncharacterized protein YqeY